MADDAAQDHLKKNLDVWFSIFDPSKDNINAYYDLHGL